ncbi:MAG: trigger factor [Oscillospiraceae bacterium]|nr:trigger factor [Oscillospiraceae bacterium]
MTVKSVEKEKNIAKIQVEIGKEQFEAAVQGAYLKARKNIMLPGFRKGKAPRAMIERMYGASVFYEDAINDIFPEVYEAAISAEKLQVVGMPSVTNVDFAEDGAVVLTVETALYPEVTLGEYKGIEVPKTAVRITEAEVEAEIDRMAQRNARILTVEREAKMGDSVVFDFEGFVDGVAFEGGKAENHTLKLGSGQFIPGFEEALVGAKAGEDRDVNVTFPEAYDPKLAGKDATFKCKIHEVKETIVPEKDDEFVKDVSEFDTMDELKKDIKARLKKDREEAARAQFENDAVTAAAANMTVDIPACMIDEQVDKHMEQFAYQLQMNGMSMEDYAKMAGGNMAAMRASMRPVAETTVRSNLLLCEVAEKENLTVSDEEITAEMQKVADQYGMELAKVQEALSAEAVRSELKTRKAVQFIADNAKAVSAKKPAAKKEEGETAEKKPAAKKAPAKKAEGETAEKKPAAKKAPAKKAEGETTAKKAPAKKPAAKKTEE